MHKRQEFQQHGPFDVAADVAHELRTPIASIAMFGEFLGSGRVTAPEKVVEYGRRIEQESRRLRCLIDNVLDAARSESGRAGGARKRKKKRTKMAVGEVVARAVRAVDAPRAQGGFRIAVTAPERPLPVVQVDEAAMTQVFVNLLDNAMKYSGQSRRIGVHLSARGAGVAVRVSDAGVGFAREDRERIFERFYRAPAAGGRDVAGTGLGLAIVRRVVGAHGGRIDVEGERARGAAFTVVLPAAGRSTTADRADRAEHADRAGAQRPVDAIDIDAGAGRRALSGIRL